MEPSTAALTDKAPEAPTVRIIEALSASTLNALPATTVPPLTMALVSLEI